MMCHCIFRSTNSIMCYFLYSAVRVAVYRTLELWVRVGGASLLQGSPSHLELLFTHLIGDITPGAEAVKVKYLFLFKILNTIIKVIIISTKVEVVIFLYYFLISSFVQDHTRLWPIWLALLVNQGLDEQKVWEWVTGSYCRGREMC